MTPKEKATDLFTKFMPDLLSVATMDNETYEINRKFALITANEILDVLFQHHKIDYWKEVKSEIEKL